MTTAAVGWLADAAEIYRRSFAIARAEADLSAMPEDVAGIALRIVHATGMPEIARDLTWTADVAASARAALTSGAPVLCDCRMVEAAIARDRLPARNPVLCPLAEPAVPEMARRLATTRSAAAVDLWQPHLAGAVVAIGNAPTALFRLLDRLAEGWPKPAAILAFPVGFVGAAESKAALVADPRGIPYMTLPGRRGGSPMAAAAVNALVIRGEVA